MEELDILIEKWDYILQTFKKEYDIQDISFKYKQYPFLP